MSVGVCIINRNGIALAADSAGTYTGNKMFYNSMNKVFSLSRKYVYGAITYGATTIYNVSIDQVLKEFRTYLDSREHISDFFEILPLFEAFINQNSSYYKFDLAEANHCNGLIKDLVVDWGNKIKTVATEVDAENKISEILNQLETVMRGSLKIDNYDVSAYIKTTYNDYFNMLIGMIVPELNNFPTQKECFWDYICNYFNLSLTNETNNYMGLFFAGYGHCDALPDTFTIDQKNALKTSLSSSKAEIASAINTTIQNDNVKPILDSVQLIPLPEMGFLAESLVNITSLKRTFAIDGNQQTVGGPTDVAVMSKGDGFVWIKRKHYFDKQMNPDYIMKIHESQ